MFYISEGLPLKCLQLPTKIFVFKFQVRASRKHSEINNRSDIMRRHGKLCEEIAGIQTL